MLSKAMTVNNFWKEEKWGVIILAASILLSTYFYPSIIMVGCAFIILLRMKWIVRCLDIDFFILLAAFISFSYIVISFHNIRFYSGLYYTISSVGMYVLGNYYMQRWKSVDVFVVLMTLLATSLAIPHIYVTVIDIFEFGLINPGRQLLSLTEDDTQRTITARAIELSLVTFGYAIAFYKPSSRLQRFIKWHFIVFAILSLLCFIHYISRTGIAISLVAIMIGFFWQERFRFLLIFVLILLYFFSGFREGELFSLFADREQFGSSVMDAGGRTERWTFYLEDLSNHPYGQESNYYAHNLWLDIAKSAGIIPFVLLVLFSLLNLIRSSYIILKKPLSPLLRLSVLSFFSIFLMSNFTECIHEGMPLFLFTYCMFCGMVSSISKKNNILYYKSK